MKKLAVYIEYRGDPGTEIFKEFFDVDFSKDDKIHLSELILFINKTLSKNNWEEDFFTDEMYSNFENFDDPEISLPLETRYNDGYNKFIISLSIEDIEKTTINIEEINEIFLGLSEIEISQLINILKKKVDM